MNANVQHHTTSWKVALASSLFVVANVIVAVHAGASGQATTFGGITVSNVGATSATVHASVEPGGIETTTWIAYSTNPTPPFASKTPAQDIGSSTTLVPISVNLTGLVPNTEYYVQVVAENSSTTTAGPLDTFTTSATTATPITLMTMKDNRLGVNLASISCPEASMCWATGYVLSRKRSIGIIDQLRNGIWIPATTSTLNLSGIDCLSTTSCWAVGSTGTNESEGPAALHFNGRSWTRISVPEPMGTRIDYLSAVTCTSTSSCWAVGGLDGASPLGRALVEHWNGASWSVVASPGPSGDSLLNAVSCTSVRSCWAVGIANDFGSASSIRSLIEHWDGRSWSPAKGPLVPYGLFGVSCRWKTACFAIGMKILQFSGGSWRAASITHSSGGAVDCSAPNNCWETTGGQTMNWNGTSWMTVGGPSVPTSQFLSLDAMNCVAGGPCIFVGSMGRKNATGYSTRALAERTTIDHS